MSNPKYPGLRLDWSITSETHAEFIGENQVKLMYEATRGLFGPNPETTTDSVLVTRRVILGREVLCFPDRVVKTGENAICAYTYVNGRGWIYVGAKYRGVSSRHEATFFDALPVLKDTIHAFKMRDAAYAKQFANVAQL